MEKVWVTFIDGDYDIALFSTAEKAYESLLDILSDHSLTEDPVEREYWKRMTEDLTVDYNRGDEDFGCDYCWAKLEEVF